MRWSLPVSCGNAHSQDEPEVDRRKDLSEVGAARADHLERGCASGHLMPELLEALTRVAFALIDELDRGILRQGSADHRAQTLADRLIDEILVVVGAAYGPF